jgi:hypothetical protein
MRRTWPLRRSRGRSGGSGGCRLPLRVIARQAYVSTCTPVNPTYFPGSLRRLAADGPVGGHDGRSLGLNPEQTTNEQRGTAHSGRWAAAFQIGAVRVFKGLCLRFGCGARTGNLTGWAGGVESVDCTGSGGRTMRLKFLSVLWGTWHHVRRGGRCHSAGQRSVRTPAELRREIPLFHKHGVLEVRIICLSLVLRWGSPQVCL